MKAYRKLICRLRGQHHWTEKYKCEFCPMTWKQFVINIFGVSPIELELGDVTK